MQFSLIILYDIVSLKRTIIPVMGHFITSVKFHEIPRVGSKFRGLRQTVGLNYVSLGDIRRR